MKFIKMSQNNTVFLFEDRKKKNFKIYKLQKEKDEQYTFVL